MASQRKLESEPTGDLEESVRFCYARGMNGIILTSFELYEDQQEWLTKMQEKFGLPNESKTLRVLIDFARARPGHWVEDAVYFEHLFWSRRAALGGRKPCSLVARRRKQTGLPVDENWPQLASIRRAMLALTT